jgi:hypothetical protein
MKYLYSFQVLTESEVEKTSSSTNELGQEVVTKSKEIVKTPITIKLKKPVRNENDDLRLFYGSQIKKAVDNGLLTKGVLVNKHIDGAGALLSKETAKRIADLSNKIDESRNKLVKLGKTEDNAEKQKEQEDLLYNLLEAQRELNAIESSNQVIFSNTVEAYAQEKASMWLILNQTFVEKDNKVEPMFKGKNFEEKESHAFDLEENKDIIFDLAKGKLTLFWGFYALGKAVTEEDFKELEKEYEESLAGE